MKHIMFLFVIVALFFSAAKTEAQCVVGLKSATKAELCQTIYTINLPKVPGYKHPYAGIEFNIKEGQWPKIDISDSDGDGFYEVSFTRYNGPMKLYWSDTKKPRNPLQEKDPMLDKGSGCISFVCIDGNIFPMGTELPKPPGEFGDNIIRYDDLGEDIVLYCNFSLFGETITCPFIQPSIENSDGKKWAEWPAEIIDASGWGKIVISKYDILTAAADDNSEFQVRLGFGASSKLTGKKIYLDPKISVFGDPKGSYTVKLESNKCY